MTQEGKKISFGFSKSIKKPELKLITQPEIKKVDYIEYVDDKSIKVIGKEEIKDEPLIIPMLGSKSWHDRIINKINVDIYGSSGGDAQKNDNAKQSNENKKLINGGDKSIDTPNISIIEKTEIKNQKQLSDTKISLEELAAKELMNDLQENDNEIETTVDLSIEQSDNLVGEKEPTIENYEEIPVDKFGIALLRGMGWEPEKGIGKTPKVVPITQSNLRPRGMGLGADKILQKQNVKIKSKTKDEEELKLTRGCFVKIIAGKYNNSYGQLESFDDDTGRLIIKLALGNKCVSLNESIIEPVTKENYTKNSKVLNISTYEKFSNKLDSKRVIDTLDLDEMSKKNEENIQDKRSRRKKSSKHRDKSSTNDDDSSEDSDGEINKRKYESNGKDNYHKSRKLKKHRRHDDSELSRKSSKKDKSRERTRNRSRTHHSSSNKSDKKKHKKHKRSRSKSQDKR